MHTKGLKVSEEAEAAVVEDVEVQGLNASFVENATIDLMLVFGVSLLLTEVQMIMIPTATTTS